jgi:Integrase core domain
MRGDSSLKPTARSARANRCRPWDGVHIEDPGSMGLPAQREAALHYAGQANGERYIESFYCKFREECLNEHWFLTLDDARETIEDWRLDYIQVRPHSSLGYRTPEEFRSAMGYADVESKERFPHLHSPDGGELISLLNPTPSTLACPDYILPWCLSCSTSITTENRGACRVG